MDAAPCQIPHHILVFVLPTAVVTMELCGLLPQSIVIEEEFQIRNDRIRSLADGHALVDEEVDLPRERNASQFIPNTAHFRGVRKYIGPG